MLYNPFSTSKHHIENIGGKGLGILQLAQMGCKIPYTRILGIEAFEVFLTYNNMDFERISSLSPTLRQDFFSKSVFPQNILHNIYKEFSNYTGTFAVRSSAVGEDGTQKSFAGQYVSLMQVTKQDLPSAIQKCWASLFSEQVRSYNTTTHTMAVVIQEYIQASWSGIAYSINPRNGSFSEIIIESFPDVGEKVVSSAVIPDYLVIRRPRPLPFPFRRISRKIRLAIKSKNDVSHSPLPEQIAIDISKIILRSEDKLGMPQDMEWIVDEKGDLYILQTRPITAISQQSTGTIWTRNFIGERWTVPATQLGWEEMQEQIEYLIAYPKTSNLYLRGEPATKLHEGSPYLHATIFRHLLFKPPGREPSPKFFMEMLPPDEIQSLCAQFSKSPDWKVYASILQTTFEEKRWERFRWNPISNWATWPEFERNLDVFLTKEHSEIQSMEQGKKRLQACRNMCHEYLKIHIGSVIHGNLFYQASSWWLQEEGFAPHLYLRSAKITSTQRCNWDLWKLARNHRNLRSFLLQYGHRSESSWALFSKRWIEQEELVLKLSETTLQQENPQIQDCQLLDGLKQRTSELPIATRFMIHITQKYLYLREEQRFHFEKLLWLWKQTWMWFERYTDTPLRHLSKSQISDILNGKDDQEHARNQQNAWEELYEKWKKNGQPADYLIDDVPIPSTSPTLKGLGISKGIVRGYAIVVRDINEITQVQKGDILVVTTLDPAWTPLFLRAGGLISELGGVLSHGAIIAREYQLPAVVAVRGVMQRIQTGDEIVLNGDTGTIILL